MLLMLSLPLSLQCLCSSLKQGIFLFFLVKYKPLKYNNVYTYPDWGYAIGWVMALSSMVCIPLGMVYKIWKTEGTFLEVRRSQHPFYLVLCVCPFISWSFIQTHLESFTLGLSVHCA